MRYFLYSATVFLLLPFFTYAGNTTGSISGKIQEESGEPVPFANVILLTNDSIMVKVDYSKEDGSFAFLNLNSGRYRVRISSVQYNGYYSEMLDLEPGRTLEMPPVVLKSMVKELEGVEVKATRPLVDVQPDKTVFNVAGSTNATGSDGLEVLKKAPGVVVDNNNNIMVQGKRGIRIYIDGKPSHLSGDDLVNMLRGMQAEGIDAIEIITNPSARFDAEGGAGIINIKLKRDKNLGLSSSINVGYNQGKFSNFHGTYDFNYRAKNLNVFGNFNHTRHQGYHFEDFYRELNGYFFNSENDMHWKYPGNHFRIGADYSLNKKHLVGILVNGNINDFSIKTDSYTPFGLLETNELSQVLLAGNLMRNPRTNVNTNLNYQYNGEDGSKLTIDLDYGYYDKNAGSNQFNHYLDPNTLEKLDSRLSRDEQLTRIDINTMKADYERKLGPGNLGLGFKLSDIKTDNQYTFYRIEGEGDIMDPDRSNDFNYLERVNAGYFTYSGKISDKIQFNGGLRLENTFSKGLLESRKNAENSKVENHYTDLFPSGGLSWQMDKKSRFALNYSRRINRPNYENLNPFEFKLDELTQRRGNPFLKPQYTHNFQLTHSFNQKLNTQLSYSITKDFFAQVFYPNGEKGSLITEKNIADAVNLGLNVNYNLDVTKWWNMFTNLNLYRAEYKAHATEDPGTFRLNVDQTTFNGYLKNSLNMPGDFSLEISGWYNSKSIWGGTFQIGDLWSMDLGVKKNILKDKGTVTVSLTDVFLSTNWHGIARYNGIYLDGMGGNDNRQLKVGFSYRFGNQQVKASRRRSTGLEDEKNRLGNNNQ